MAYGPAIIATLKLCRYPGGGQSLRPYVVSVLIGRSLTPAKDPTACGHEVLPLSFIGRTLQTSFSECLPGRPTGFVNARLLAVGPRISLFSRLATKKYSGTRREMGLTRGQKDQTDGVHESGTASSPRIGIPKPHLPKLELPHKHKEKQNGEKSDKEDSPKRHRHLRRSRGGDQGSHKQLLSLRNPFSKKKPTEAAAAPAGDVGPPQPVLAEEKHAVEASPTHRADSPPPPPVAEPKSLLAVDYVENGRQKSDTCGDTLPAPVGYRHSFGESICGSKGPFHDFPDGTVGLLHTPCHRFQPSTILVEEGEHDTASGSIGFQRRSASTIGFHGYSLPPDL